MKHWIMAAVLGTVALGAYAQATEAEVRKVDPAQGKLTLKHAEVKHLDMPPMTMVFRVRDPKMLDGVVAGDKLLVDIAKIDGQYTVTALRKVP
jgi:Cu(I)/Ag(I) efflux system periplasmic protein CusF